MAAHGMSKTHKTARIRDIWPDCNILQRRTHRICAVHRTAIPKRYLNNFHAASSRGSEAP
jgi:hypothetical protein